MPTLRHAVPKYRKHRASGQAIVSIGGRDHYLGAHGTKASKVEYDRLIAEWLTNDRHPVRSDEEQAGITVAELLARYWKHAQGHYRRNGEPTETIEQVRYALRPVRQLYGHTQAREFGPLALKAVRQTMIGGGLSRGVVNFRIGKIKQAFKWAVGEQLIASMNYQALQAVPGLQKGRSEARETEPVGPVEDSVVGSTLEHLGTVVADLVQLQRLTGCRPSEVCMLRPGDIDRTGEVWEYRPAAHKTEHHGRSRVILIGPKAQVVLTPYLLRPADAYCFSPAEAEARHRESRHAARVTPLSCGNRPGTNRSGKPKRRPGERYTRDSYRRAVHRACDKAGVKRWSPNRLRHSAATQIRSKYGLEAAQTVLGHARADITQVYAERDMELARRIMREVG